ncbi:MAG: hypothetical protein K0R63_1856 [Rickettsiales bacterium]|jgi:hypothetical protein|nr:hypothetical protein [Rickettsiales bacterium]
MPSNSNEQSKKEQVLTRMGVFGVAAWAAASVNIAFQNIKIRKQVMPQASYAQSASALYQEAGLGGFYRGYWPYIARVGTVFSFIGPFSKYFSEKTKETNLSPLQQCLITAPLTAAVETFSTGAYEAHATARSKKLAVPGFWQGFPNISWAQRHAHAVAPMVPALLPRNITYWLGVMGAANYGDYYDMPLESRATLGAAAGVVAGLVSTPLDRFATLRCGASEGMMATVKGTIEREGIQYFMAGASMRATQMGISILGTSIALEGIKYLEARRQYPLEPGEGAQGSYTAKVIATRRYPSPRQLEN